MKVHELNCGSLAPLSARLVNGSGPWFGRGRLVCRSLLLEGSPHGLILVETGVGTCSLGSAFGFAARPRYDPAETPHARIRSLGFRPEDVRDIVVTHLDMDHAAGLRDFPWARVHLRSEEYEFVVLRPDLRARIRFRSRQWQHGVDWKPERATEEWRGFPASRLQDEVLLVALPGHSPGHAGVAVRTSAGWIFHCGDAFFHRGQVDPRRPWCPPGLAVFQALVQWDRRVWARTLERLRALARDPAVRLVCAHDPVGL